jgi:hypothetical protein
VVCEPVDTPAEPTPDPAPAPGPEPETPRSRGRPKGAPNKVKEPRILSPVLEVADVVEVVEPVREKQKKEKAAPKAVPKAAPKVQRDASPAPFEPTFEELLGHMGRAMAQQRAVRAQGRSDLYSQFLS